MAWRPAAPPTISALSQAARHLAERASTGPDMTVSECQRSDIMVHRHIDLDDDDREDIQEAREERQEDRQDFIEDEHDEHHDDDDDDDDDHDDDD
jgi:hypothetical protein